MTAPTTGRDVRQVSIDNLSGSSNEGANRVDWQDETVKAMLAQSERCRVLLRGQDAVKEAGVAYLPMGRGERWQDYRARLNRSVLFNGFQATVETFAGLVFRSDPVIQAPENFDLEPFDDIDLTGQSLAMFARDVFTEQIAMGHAGILVDYPTTEGPMSLRDRADRAIRPYWRLVAKDDIHSWRAERVGGMWMLTQLVVKEAHAEPVGQYGVKHLEQFRVYRREAGVITVEVWRERADRKDGREKYELVEEPIAIKGPDAIPFVAAYARRDGVLQSVPPLLKLADLNIAHYQVLSDHLWMLHKASVPMLVVTGARAPRLEFPEDGRVRDYGIDSESGDVAIGPNVVLELEDASADAKYIEHSGAAGSLTRTMYKDLEQAMAAQGVAFLQVEQRQAETAEAKRLDRSEKDSALSVAALSLENALNRALEFHMQFQGAELPADTRIVLNRDYEAFTLTAPEAAELRAQLEIGALSWESWFRLMQEGGWFDEDLDLEEEKTRLLAGPLITPRQPEAPPGSDDDEDEDEDEDGEEEEAPNDDE